MFIVDPKNVHIFVPEGRARYSAMGLARGDGDKRRSSTFPGNGECKATD